MPSECIHLEPVAEHPSSLVACIGALSPSVDHKLDCDALSAALGLSLVTWGAADAPIGCWPSLGHDRFLEQVAGEFGLALRDLHPPDVGLEMLKADEFPQHFEFSYKPLIARAIENNQPVLAWQGWQEPDHFEWGVITHLDEGTPAGTTLHKTTNRLIRPAMQCYVVEKRQTVTVDRQRVLTHAFTHVQALLSGTAFSVATSETTSPIVAGSTAVDLWRVRLHELAERPTTDKPRLSDWGHFVQQSSALRRAGARFLGSFQNESLREAAARCGAVADTLEQDLLPVIRTAADADHLANRSIAQPLQHLYEAESRAIESLHAAAGAGSGR